MGLSGQILAELGKNCLKIVKNDRIEDTRNKKSRKPCPKQIRTRLNFDKGRAMCGHFQGQIAKLIKLTDPNIQENFFFSKNYKKFPKLQMFFNIFTNFGLNS